jgi:uncharacterized membrane protein
MNRRPSVYARVALAATIALALLLVLWELVLAPLRPGGTWLALKALPLALLIPGVARASPPTLQWLPLVLLAHFSEGIVRGWSESGRHSLVAWAAAALATLAFVALFAWLRHERQPPDGS